MNMDLLDNSIDTVIFDLDGTLVDTLNDVVSSVNFSLSNNNIPVMGMQEIKSLLGVGLEIMLETFLKKIEARNNDFSSLEKLKKDYLLYYKSNPCSEVRLYPNVEPTLVFLQALGCKLALCTNKPYELTKSIIDFFEIGKYFSVVVCGDTLSSMKPSAEPLLYILDYLKKNPSNAVLVGDTSIDYSSAVAAGINFIYARYGYGEGVVCNPLFSIDSIDELKIKLICPIQ